MPYGEFTYSGCACAGPELPAVGYRTWPMPMLPVSVRMWRVWNTSRTRPLSLRRFRRPPSQVMMPAASCPRCCRTVRLSYSAWLTFDLPTMPTMPHMLNSVHFNSRNYVTPLTTYCQASRRHRWRAFRRQSEQVPEKLRQHHDVRPQYRIAVDLSRHVQFR